MIRTGRRIFEVRKRGLFMKMKSRTLFLSTAAVLAGAGVAIPAAAQSAAAASKAETGSDEIIVTARRQSEKLQDVPASITVFTAKAP